MNDCKSLHAFSQPEKVHALLCVSILVMLTACHSTKIQSTQPSPAANTASPSNTTLHRFETRTIGTPSADNTVLSAVFVPGTSLAISSSGDGTATVWDLATAKELRHFTGPGFTFASIAVSADGKSVLTTGFKSNLHLWSLATGKDLQGLPVTDSPGIAIALSPDRIHAAVSYNNVVHLWTLSTDNLEPSIKITAAITGMVFADGGKTLVWVQDDANVCRWNLDPTAQPSCKSLTFDDLAAHVAASKDGSRLLIGGHHMLILWDVASASVIHTWNTQATELSAIALSPDSTQALWADDTAHVHLWNIQTGSQIAAILGPGKSDSTLSFSNDGAQALIGGDDGTLKLWALN